MWSGNFRTWAVPQIYQNSVLDKVGITLYLIRSSSDDSTYEDSNTLLSDTAERFKSFNIESSFKGFIDFEPTRKILGKFKSITWQLDPSGNFFLPDKSKLITAFFPLTQYYNTYDYILLRGEDAPHLGTTTLYRIVETVTEGNWTPLKMLVGLSVVSDNNLIKYLENLVLSKEGKYEC